MEWQELVLDAYGRAGRVLERALDGMTPDDLAEQPRPDCNSMGWLAWHLTRWQDRVIADLMGEEQLWIGGGWHRKFNRPADPRDTGMGHTPEQVKAFRSEAATLLAYHRAVLERSRRYIAGLTPADLERKLNNPRSPTVADRLIGVISDNLQHAGQAAYVRGLIKGKGWMEA